MERENINPNINALKFKSPKACNTIQRKAGSLGTPETKMVSLLCKFYGSFPVLSWAHVADLEV